MASTSFCAIFILSCVFFFLVSPSSSSSIAQKVPLAIYYESLCPWSTRYVTHELADVFLVQDQELINIIDLRLVPYGNAHTKDGFIYCEHGEVECKLNTFEACAIHALPDPKDHFSVIYCVENLVEKDNFNLNLTKLDTCWNKNGVDSEAIWDCFGSKFGLELHLRYGNETDHLKPPHKYVPWVVVDNKPLYEDYENFVSYVCKAYKGRTLPKACKKPSLRSIPEANEKQLKNKASYPDQTP